MTAFAQSATSSRALLVADRDEARGEPLELLVVQPVHGVGGIVADAARVGLGLAGLGEGDKPRVAGDHRRKLLEQRVHPPLALRGQRGDGTSQILAVVLGQGRNSNRAPERAA